MSGKMTIDEALEWMRKQNREDPNPCLEDSFEETLQGLARPMMEAGLIEDVQATDPGPFIGFGVDRYLPEEWDADWTMVARVKEDPTRFYNYVLGEWFDPEKKA